MCAISGLFATAESTLGPTRLGPLFHELLDRAGERGRDSTGVYYDGAKWATTSAEPVPLLRIGRVALANNRGEPTTEWVQDKSLLDVQPYGARISATDSLVLVHNGTVANDKDIAERLHSDPPNIDSKVLAPLLARDWDGTLGTFVAVLDTFVVGSYALAVYDEQRQSLYLAANYKPLFTEWRNGVLFFASLPHHLPGHGDLRASIHKLPPYSALKIDRTGWVERAWLSTGRMTSDDQKALVVASGGLDSSVVATQLVREGYDVTLLHFDYAARATGPERRAVDALADELGVPVVHVQTDIFKAVIGASRLTNTAEGIAPGEAGAELAHEWVPARNLIMTSLAVGIAEARGIGTLALGNNLEESGAYPDNEQEFIRALNAVMPNAVNLDRRVRIIEPVGNLMKHEIVRRGLELGAPLHLTWSCYNDGELHCGECGPCYMRRRAFEMNATAEVIEYAA